MKWLSITTSWLVLALILNAAQAQDTFFVALSAVDGVDMLPAPPANDSDAVKAELADLHRIQNQRGAGAIARAQADAAETDVSIFKSALGGRFSVAALPLTNSLAAHVAGDEYAYSKRIKAVFHRMRPYHLDKSLHPVCPMTAKDDSYPSGHTMDGYVLALLLASMLPEKKDAIFARAEDYAHNRLVCGVHYPSDVEAGKEIAYAFFAVMAADPRFKTARAAAQAELRKSLGLAAQVE